MVKALLLLWFGYFLIGAAMVGWGEGWVESMGCVYLLCIPLSGILCRALQSKDLVWCSYTAYGVGLVMAFFKGVLMPLSNPGMIAVVVGGAFLAIALPVGVLMLLASREREEL